MMICECSEEGRLEDECSRTREKGGCVFFSRGSCACAYIIFIVLLGLF